MSDTVNLKNQDVPEALNALQELGKLKVNARAALSIRGIVKTLRDRKEDLEEVQKQITERYTEKDAEGNPVPGTEEGTVRITNFREFLEEVGELQEQTLEVQPVLLSWFAKDAAALDKLDVEPNVFIALGDLLIADVE